VARIGGDTNERSSLPDRGVIVVPERRATLAAWTLVPSLFHTRDPRWTLRHEHRKRIVVLYWAIRGSLVAVGALIASVGLQWTANAHSDRVGYRREP
jgi:hypothetical protein